MSLAAGFTMLVIGALILRGVQHMLDTWTYLDV